MPNYADHVSEKKTPQKEPIPSKDMVENSEGGYVFAVNDWTRLNRFLILGAEGGNYYANERDLTKENYGAVINCIKENGQKVVEYVVQTSHEGRAAKNDPALFVLALCTKFGDEITRKMAFDLLPKVARIGTHLFTFVAMREALGGWGRGMRRAVAKWYTDKDADKLAYQVAKYQQRDGWSHGDLLRLSHPNMEGEHEIIAKWILNKENIDASKLPAIIESMEIATAIDKKQVGDLIRQYGLTREMVPTEHLSDPSVQEALLENMPITAMIRNLGNMSKSGLLVPMSDAEAKIIVQLQNAEKIKKSRLHPISILLALKTYASGHGFRGKGTWTVAPRIVDALNDAFYMAFDNIEPMNKRVLIGIDVSGSMRTPINNTNLMASEAASAMALVIAKTEPQYYIHGFTGGGCYHRHHYNDAIDGFVDLGITPNQRLDDVVRKTRGLTFGSTDCALPMLYALKNNIYVDLFVVITDSETWAGHIHPTQALQKYRREINTDARLAVLGTTSNGFSIADLDDAGMMDFVGFDAGLPSILSEFGRGSI